jgi:hypothetical protein
VPLKISYGDAIFKIAITISFASGIYGLFIFDVYSFGIAISVMYYMFYVNFYNNINEYGEKSRIISKYFIVFSIAMLIFDFSFGWSQFGNMQKITVHFSLLLVSISCVIKTSPRRAQ